MWCAFVTEGFNSFFVAEISQTFFSHKFVVNFSRPKCPKPWQFASALALGVIDRLGDLGDLGDLASRARLRSLRCASLRCASLRVCVLFAALRFAGLFAALRCASLLFAALSSLRVLVALLRFASHPPTRCCTRHEAEGISLRSCWSETVVDCDGRGFTSNLQYLSLRASLSSSLSSHAPSLCPLNREKPARSAYATRSVVAEERVRVRESERQARWVEGGKSQGDRRVQILCCNCVFNSVFVCADGHTVSYQYCSPSCSRPCRPMLLPY